jgi:hypothetical protein
VLGAQNEKGTIPYRGSHSTKENRFINNQMQYNVVFIIINIKTNFDGRNSFSARSLRGSNIRTEHD